VLPEQHTEVADAAGLSKDLEDTGLPIAASQHTGLRALRGRQRGIHTLYGAREALPA